MTATVCTDCPTIITAGPRCPDCERQRDKARGTRQERGYNAGHDRLRRTYQNHMNAGHTYTCWRCRKPITPGQPWDLGHDDEDRTTYRGPEHAACNRATATHAAQRRREGLSDQRRSVDPPTT